MKILTKTTLYDSKHTKITSMTISAPEIAAKAMAGQFVVIMINAEAERIPLTIVEKDMERGTIKIIFQEAGFTTRMLGKMMPGEKLFALAGPLGHPTDIKKIGQILIIGGGVGIAEIYPVGRAFRDAGNMIKSILGARTNELIILQSEIEAISDKLLIATDDGSSGYKGLNTELLEKEIAERKPDLIYAVGPIPMMRNASLIGARNNIKTIVSLNALMVDATGMCGCCRVTVSGKTLFSCVDGPEFDGREVNWEELMNRSKMYKDKEDAICRLNGIIRS